MVIPDPVFHWMRLDAARLDLAARHEMQHPESIDELRVRRDVARAQR